VFLGADPQPVEVGAPVSLVAAVQTGSSMIASVVFHYPDGVDDSSPTQLGSTFVSTTQFGVAGIQHVSVEVQLVGVPSPITAAVDVEVTQDGELPSPMFVSVPFATGAVGESYHYNGPNATTDTPAIRGYGPFVLSMGAGSPSGAVIDQSQNAIVWRPGQGGKQRLYLTAQDTRGTSATQTFIVDVKSVAGACQLAGPRATDDTVVAMLASAMMALLLRRRRA
jgi:hypothetical protein